jgi:hypothetical protein
MISSVLNEADSNTIRRGGEGEPWPSTSLAWGAILHLAVSDEVEVPEALLRSLARYGLLPRHGRRRS